MSDPTVRQIVQSRVAAAWNTAQVPVEYENETAGKREPTGYYAYVDFPFASADQITVGAPGANIFRETGLFRVSFFGPRGKGTGPLATYAKQFGLLFRDLNLGGVIFRTPSPPVTGDGSADGVWFRATIRVPYEFDSIG